ncbi:J domain protein [Lambdina fiscellaria nucleopolyhedrovirus]|uniref:J domain protein n=1 Tax=Lambdina fiscellaria nucleopolyhedrovirus TaxID=1642929 RepID=A0A0E3URS2_9ABAC|nr:J domain protein [Lambdina fiscellaria nucleopolyhedrovirus]AKC91724.1 J domain protein [Lambdina fiscellaria nucleopolyhedrovirus]
MYAPTTHGANGADNDRVLRSNSLKRVSRSFKNQSSPVKVASLLRKKIKYNDDKNKNTPTVGDDNVNDIDIDIDDDDDDDDNFIRRTSKLPRSDRLIDLNLDAVNLYTIIGVAQTEKNFISSLNYHMQSAQRSYSDHRKWPVIKRATLVAFHVLSHTASRRKYDQCLREKNNVLAQIKMQIVPTQKTIEPLLAKARLNLNELDAAVTKCKSQTETRVTAEIMHVRNLKKPLKNKAFNRVQVSWKENLLNDDDKNDNDDDDNDNKERMHEIIKNYFAKFGTVYASVMCANNKHCALVEYTNLASMMEAVNTAPKNNIFSVKQLNSASIIESVTETVNKLRVDLNALQNYAIERKKELDDALM